MEQTVHSYYGLSTPKPKTGRKSVSSELVGIEVELEKVKLNVIHSSPKHWKTVEDHSLKDNGLEFTLLTYHNKALPHLVELFKTQSTADPSTRCSIHVHVNALDLTLDQIKSWLIYYMIFERALYNYSGKRWGNIFCVPLREWFSTFSAGKLDHFHYIAEGWEKYSGLNLLSLSQHGTVEFRQMTGNTNPKYIQNWIEMLVALKKYAKNKTSEEALKEIYELNSTSAYWHLIDAIFGQYAIGLQYANFKKDIEDCIAHAKLAFLDTDELVPLQVVSTTDQYFSNIQPSCAVLLQIYPIHTINEGN